VIRHRSLGIVVFWALLAAMLPLSGSATATTPTELFFSEYIEGTSNNKALEIYNGTGASVDLASGQYVVQMFFNGSTTSGLNTSLTGTVAPGDVFVLANPLAVAAILSQADQITVSSAWYNGDDAVVLRKGGLSGAIVDVIGQIGVDPGTEWGTGVSSTQDNTLRRKVTITAGDTNGADGFDPSLEWDGFAVDTFDGLGSHSITSGGDAAPAVASTSPSNGASGVAINANIVITFTESVSVSDGWYAISCTSSGAHTATQSGGTVAFTLDPDSDFANAESCAVTVDKSKVTDLDTDDPPDAMGANHVFSFTTVAATRSIHEIQGAAHISPLNGQLVGNVAGIVTAKRSNGFYLQDPAPDADDATSEGIFVFTSSAPAVNVGDSVTVHARVTEFRPGGASSANLTTTELVSPSIAVVSSGGVLPAPIVIGMGGRVPPSTIIEDDASGSVETSGVFDPSSDGLDFYESLEAMRVQVNGAVALDATEFGETPVLADNGAGAGPRTARGGILYGYGDGNPERIFLDDEIVRPVPLLNVGDHFAGPVVGVVDYSFGNFKVELTATPVRVADGVTRETTEPSRPRELSVATFNVENLDGRDPPQKFAALAGLIVNNLRAPDLIAIEEIQDNTGPGPDPSTDATVTWQRLIAAIQAAGGPTYDFRQIDPLFNQDGGEPNGNIRQGFLFRTDRGLEFVDRPGGTASTATHDNPSRKGAQLTLSPGRIDPTNSAFVNSRKPLVGEFRWRGKTFFAIANHFNSKGGDHPLFGRFQPPVRSSEVQRHQQAAIVNAFVDELLAADKHARIVVLGDINDFEFSETLDILKGNVLVNLMDTLPQAERYSYVFEGNSQVLDQILVSARLFKSFEAYDSVHVNAEFADQDSDHDPQLARLRFGQGDDDEEGDED
jgi:predicted extracellular nuclease